MDQVSFSSREVGRLGFLHIWHLHFLQVLLTKEFDDEFTTIFLAAANTCQPRHEDLLIHSKLHIVYWTIFRLNGFLVTYPRILIVLLIIFIVSSRTCHIRGLSCSLHA